MMDRRRLARRDLLKAGGAVVVSFSLPGAALAAAGAESAAPAGRMLDKSEVEAFLALHPNGTVTVYSGKVDLGTGLRIAMRQLVAEELGIEVDAITLIEGDTALTPDQGPTAGSTGIAVGGVQIRQAAATARHALRQRAAKRLGLPLDELDLFGGEVRSATGETVAVGTLLARGGLRLKLDGDAPLRPPAGYRVVGQPLPRPDIPAKVTGRQLYVHDFVLPGLWHGRVIRPPAIGAVLTGVDETSLAAFPGVRIVRIRDFIGVVAEHEWTAVRAARQLKL